VNLDYYDLDKVYFTADHHFGHANIIKFCNRPFENVNQMDAALIERWNSKVPADGVVFHLGDFTLGGALEASQRFESLNGTIKFLANPWHHDKRWLQFLAENPNAQFRTFDQWKPVEILPPIVVLEIPNPVSVYPLVITLCHYPMGEWDRGHYGAWHLHGHSHGKYKSERGGKIMDVGVDCCDFAPVSFTDVAMRMREAAD